MNREILPYAELKKVTNCVPSYLVTWILHTEKGYKANSCQEYVETSHFLSDIGQTNVLNVFELLEYLLD